VTGTEERREPPSWRRPLMVRVHAASATPPTIGVYKRFV
jgi:hypothetical protein